MQNGLYLGSYCSSGLSWFSAIDNGNVSLLWHFEVEKKNILIDFSILRREQFYTSKYKNFSLVKQHYQWIKDNE